MSVYRMTPEAHAAHQAKVKGEAREVLDALVGGKKSKYGNKRVVVDGLKFDSKREADRYLVLKAQRDAGEISRLRLQPCFPIVIDGFKICDYYADFSYERRDGVTVTEDAKGMRTEVYRIKKKLVRAVHGVVIQEI